ALGSASWTGANEKKLLNTIDDTLAKKLAGILGGGGAKEEAPAVAAAPAAKEEPVAEEAPKKSKKKAPPADEDKPAKKEEEAGSVSASASPDTEEPSGPPSPFTRLDLAVGAHVYGRNFTYNKSLQGGQQAYKLPAVPAP